MDESSILLPSSSSIKQDPSSFPKNFNSLYDLSSSSASTSLLTSSTRTTDSDSDADATPDFATVYASHRFFFSSPGPSNSIIESPDTRPEAEPNAETTTEPPPMDGGVAVKKYSPDPYKDFRLSMQEMIEARNLTDVNKDWDFLHELLICYLTLNPKNTHKFIVSAFADIIVCLLSSSPESDTPENQRR